MGMKAKARLYLTADKSRLVHAGDRRAASLYCTPGDEIPDSAVARFGIVDGTIDGGGTAATPEGAILRVGVLGSATIEVPGHVFSPGSVTEFRSGDLDEGQLLAMLKEPNLDIAGALSEGSGWIPFPGRENAIEALQGHIDYDLANGRPHDRVVDRAEAHGPHPFDIIAPATVISSAPEPTPTPAPQPAHAPAATPASTAAAAAKPKASKAKAATAAKPAQKTADAPKEQAPAEDKEAAPAENKGEA